MPSSLGAILGAARSALAAQQQVMQTAGHNIANAGTAGFSRQRVELRPNFERREANTTVGTGVRSTDVRRLRDALLDVSVRQEAGGEAAATARQELLQQVEGVLGEPSDTGLAAALDALWASWSDLATTPTSRAARSVVVQRATAVADTLAQFDSRLLALREQTTLRLDQTLGEVNALVRQVGALNARIVSAEVGGVGESSDLRDERDRAVDRLAELTGAVATVRPDGSAHVMAAGYTLVEGIHVKQLVRAEDTLGRPALGFADVPGRTLRPLGGAAQTLADFLGSDLQGVQDQLDATANGLARAVNAVHAAAQTPAGAPGAPVFVDGSTEPPTFAAGASAFGRPRAPGAVTARTIRVNPALAADPGLVSATASAARPTGNDAALAMAALRTSGTVTVGAGAGATTVAVTFVLPDRSRAPGAPDLAPTPPTAVGEFYRATATGLGVQVQAATSEATVRTTLAEQARARRQAVSGVNVDEELTTLMRAQQAYAAAAKVITAADEMSQALMQML